MSRQVIAGVDPYRADAEAIVLGALLARATGASLMVVGVYPDATTGHALGAAERDRAARAHALEGLDPVLGRLGAGDGEIGGVPFRADAVAGSSPAQALHALAAREQPAVLVVGSTHRGALGRIVPGSVTERVVHGAPCPVAVAPRGFEAADRAPARVGVAYAGTPEGELALRSAVTLATRLGAELIGYTIVDPVVYADESAGIHGYLTYPPLDADAAELERRSRSAESALRSRLAEAAPGVAAEVVVIGDGSVDSLVARTTDLDLLVCGSRGYGPLSAVLLGGVTHTLMLKSQCPLLLIPRGAGNALTQLFATDADTAP